MRCSQRRHSIFVRYPLWQFVWKFEEVLLAGNRFFVVNFKLYSFILTCYSVFFHRWLVTVHRSTRWESPTEQTRARTTLKKKIASWWVSKISILLSMLCLIILERSKSLINTLLFLTGALIDVSFYLQKKWRFISDVSEKNFQTFCVNIPKVK